MVTKPCCSVRGCGSPIKARGLCNAHWLRLRRHGDALSGGPARGSSFGSPRRYIEEAVLPFRGNEECLLWPFARRPDGRGHIRVNGDDWTAHRYVLWLTYGPPPSPQHQAAHSCGNGHIGCVAPQHLRWATGQENYDDSRRHGTNAKGERHGMRRLSEGEAREIKQRAKYGTFSALGREFGVSASAVSAIFNGRNWAWLK